MRLQLLNIVCAIAVLVLGLKTVTFQHSVLYSIGDGTVGGGQDYRAAAKLEEYGPKHTEYQHSFQALEYHSNRGKNYPRAESLLVKKIQHKQSQLCQSLPQAVCFTPATPKSQDYSTGGYFYFYPNVQFFHLPAPPPPPPPPAPPAP
eukprot:CAMPEP_0172152032 /NCGR_PEP_ID=MMETSP1050-20130122/595_1 /TAXON_ID=233186 /ORGANISM="Cryptomonas curvata, Strain CCAP979/52" /LENGTH=146 /DNA_ID=CAMNT_0012820275 /DNA_START=346 /DNA_END=782 /DNA_ORIENTATION=+